MEYLQESPEHGGRVRASNIFYLLPNKSEHTKFPIKAQAPPLNNLETMRQKALAPQYHRTRCEGGAHV